MNISNPSKTLIPLCAGIGLLLCYSCSSNEPKDSQLKQDTIVTVTVATAGADRQQGLNLSGQIEASQSVNISTRVMGYITRLNVKVGDHVSKGQLLVAINNQDILAKKAQADALISEADAAYKSAQKDYERFKTLYKQQSASAKELDNVSLQYTAAKSHLESAKQMRNEVNSTLSYTNLIAPFAGIVTQKLADEGSMATPGMPILIIERSGSYQISASVPENAISQIKLGSAATISISAINKTIKGTVSQISQSSQFSGGQYLIKLQIPDSQKEGLFAGMYANVAIPIPQAATTKAADGQVMVPLTSIVYKDALTGLYTVGNNNIALLRWVRLGKTEGNQVEVLSGLAKNEQFISTANGRLFNGATVQIKK